jgi:hypothetical protein
VKVASLAYSRAASLAKVFDALERYGEHARILAGGRGLPAALDARISG